MAKPKHPRSAGRHRIRAGHCLYQVGTAGAPGRPLEAVVQRVFVLGPSEPQRIEDGLVTAASARELEAMLAPIHWLRYYVFFSGGRAATLAATLQRALDAHNRKEGLL